MTFYFLQTKNVVTCGRAALAEQLWPPLSLIFRKLSDHNIKATLSTLTPSFFEAFQAFRHFSTIKVFFTNSDVKTGPRNGRRLWAIEGIIQTLNII